MCTFCANLNKRTAKQPSFIYQVAPSVNKNLSYRKINLKSRYNPNLPNCLQVGQNHLVVSGTYNLMT